MGYTHYWTQRRSFSKPDWQSVTGGLLRIVRAAQEAGIPLSADHGNTALNNHAILAGALTPMWKGEPVFQVNGAGDMAHETFSIHCKRPTLEGWQTPDRRGFNFCKTNRKPYDAAVTAMLIYLESTFPRHIDVSSDGDATDWQNGLKLAHAALPNGASLQLPFSLRFNALWSTAALWGHNYVAYESAAPGNMICVCRKTAVLAQFCDDAADALRLRIKKIEIDRASLPPEKQDMLADRRLATFARNAEILGGTVPDTQPV